MKTIKVVRISKKHLDVLLKNGFTVIITGGKQ